MGHFRKSLLVLFQKTVFLKRFIYFFIGKADFIEKERHKESSSIPCFTPQLATKAGVELIQSSKLEILLVSHVGSGAQRVVPFSTAFLECKQGDLDGKWISWDLNQWPYGILVLQVEDWFAKTLCWYHTWQHQKIESSFPNQCQRCFTW